MQTNRRDKTREKEKCATDVLIINGGCGIRFVSRISNCADGALGYAVLRLENVGLGDKHTDSHPRAYTNQPTEQKSDERHKERHHGQDMGLVHTRTGLAQATEDALLRAFGFWCHPSSHTRIHMSIHIHTLSTTLWPSSLFSRGMGCCIGTGLYRLRRLLSYRGGPSGDG